ncbi:MAG TPA: MarR family transcriptional regulator [Thermoanaerobaculia bacterium]|nr:MarR family transcriptional regulator [Thermoanaerobaculia bacterium]
MPTQTHPPPASPRSELSAQAEALHQALSDLVRVYQFRDRDRICCHDVSVTQCYALESLVERGPSTLNALAAALYLDKSTASRVVGTLERKGYVLRRPHPEDGRAVLLEATPAGRTLCQRIREDSVAEEGELIADLDGPARDAVITVLTRLARVAEKRAGSCGPTCEVAGASEDTAAP